MESRSLGSLPFKTSALGFGTWALGGPTVLGGRQVGWGPQDPVASERALRRALDLGITFFDTADVYGLGVSESLLGRVLGSARQNVLICTKFGNREEAGHVVKDFSPTWARVSVEASLRRLRRDCIDLLLLHSPPDDFNWAGYDPSGLERLKSEGKIRSYGVSCRGPRGAEKVLFHRFGDVIEAIYNVLDRRLASEALPAAVRHGKGVIARVPLASGFLTDKLLTTSPAFEVTDVRAELSADETEWRQQAIRRVQMLASLPGGLAVSALRFCLSHPGISTVIPGMRSAAQVEDNIRAAELGPLPASILEEIERRLPDVYAGWN